MKKGLVLLLALLGAGLFASQAFATPGPTGWIEVCKQAAAPTTAAPMALTGTFNFTIADAADVSHAVSVGVGLCSAPIQVAAGSATVTEASAPWYSVQSITEPAGQTSLGTTNLGAQTAVVNVPASTTQAGTQTVTYTDQEDPGVIEICKQIVTGSGLTGSYSFTVTGADGFTASESVPAGACSPALIVPAGSVSVQETGTVDVTSITATANGGTNELLDSNLAAGQADVTVLGEPSGTVANQTLVTFTDNVTTLKLCKAYDGTPPSPNSWPFTFAVSGVAGPAGPTAGVSLPAGTVSNPDCVIVGQYRAGTQVAITEAIVPGTQVESINVNPWANIVSGSLNTAGRTVTVNMGAGETVVTFTNENADPGTLKICKFEGSPPPVAGTTGFTFTVASNAAATKTVTVPLQAGGACVVVGSYPFNSTETITEAISTGNAVSAISVNPTSQMVGTASISAGTVAVMMTSDSIVEADYTDIDPPTAAGGGGGGGGGGGSTGGTSASSSTSGPSVVSAGTGLASTPIGLGSSTGIGTSDATALKLSRDKQELAALKATLSKLETEWSTAASVNNALARQIVSSTASLSKLEWQYTVAPKWLKHTLTNEIAKGKATLLAMEQRYSKAISANKALAKEIANTKVSETKLTAAIAVLEK